MLQKSLLKSFRISLLLVLLSIASCSEYEKLLKSNDTQRMYEYAMIYYEEGNYVRSATLIERILPVYRGSARAADLSYTLAMSYYHRNDFILAAHHFDSFVREYPHSPQVEEASFMRAYCNYRQSPRPDLDQSSTRLAIEQFGLFLNRFPDSDRVEEAQELIIEMRNKLLEKSYRAARLYYDMGDYKAAIISFKNSLADYPETEHREEILFLILKASYRLADLSVPERQIERFQAAVDEYYIFIEEFPESDYMDEANRFLNNSLRVLDSYPSDELTNSN